MTDTDTSERIRQKLAKATNAMHKVTKDSTADMGDKIGDVHYASLGQVLRTVKAALQAEGLALHQPFGYLPSDGNMPIMHIDTYISDSETGDYIMFTGPGFPVKGDPQAAAGAITYFRRYALVSFFGLIVEDDDGQQATRIHRNPTERTMEEVRIRELIGRMNDDQRGRFVSDFKTHFDMGLSELDTTRHSEAFAYTQTWLNMDPAIEPTEEGNE